MNLAQTFDFFNRIQENGFEKSVITNVACRKCGKQDKGEYYGVASKRKEFIDVYMCFDCKKDIEQGFLFGRGNTEMYASALAEKMKLCLEGRRCCLFHVYSCEDSDATDPSGFLHSVASKLRSHGYKVQLNQQNELIVMAPGCSCDCVSSDPLAWSSINCACTKPTQAFTIRLFTPNSEPLNQDHCGVEFVYVSATYEELNPVKK